MALIPGTRLGSYEILSALGVGGMGEVYRARDRKLDRDVAIKVLPELFVSDPERVARFQREAKTLASLNHPHIGGIYGFEDADGVRALVLELIEGPTLADRIAQGPIPLEETLPIAKQIADALEAAHEQGIIHRDLKPANIKVKDDGTVKVLDFGLAKLVAPEAGGAGALAGLSQSPTLTTPAATVAGVILGTAAYMSPEQAKGRATDKRSDIWAFGCVLYEMLTGRRAFQGEDVTDTIAALIRGEPDWSALPSEVPPHIRLLLKRCLEKDRKARVSDIGVARFLMTEATAPQVVAPSAHAATEPSRRRVAMGTSIGVVAGIALTAAAVWVTARLVPKPSPSLSRFAIVPPSAQPLSINPNDSNVAISPDGRHMVYRTGTDPSRAQLVVRALDQLDARPLAGVVDARNPFISPDNQWIGFFSGSELKKVSMTGGPPITVCRVTNAPRGASWGPDNTIIFATADVSTGLLSVPAGGGDPKVITRPDHARRESAHFFPSVLPDGRAVLFTITAARIEDSQVAVLDLKTGQRKTLVRGAMQGQYVETGHVIYAAAGTLRAVRFDPARLQVLSDPVPVVEQVMTGMTGAVNFAVSSAGSLVYVPGTLSTQSAAPRSLLWVNRQGREEPIQAPLRAYAVPRLSPDGSRVALDVRDQNQDIWIWDLGRRALTPLTFDPGVDMSPVWTPDGRRLIWGSAREGGIPNLYWQAADGTGVVERLTTSGNAQFPTSISPDSTRLLLFENSSNAAQDIEVLTLNGPPSEPAGQRRSEALIHTPAAEVDPEISPDGRWLAYQSNESGQPEVYVRPFPKVDSGRWPVSTAGGTRPAWARNGRELFYLDANGLLTTVPVQTTTSTFIAGNPTRILNTRYYPGFTTLGLALRGYDVSADGQRFLMIKEAPTEPSSSATPASMIVVLNWFEELKAHVPSK